MDSASYYISAQSIDDALVQDNGLKEIVGNTNNSIPSVLDFLGDLGFL